MTDPQASIIPVYLFVAEAPVRTAFVRNPNTSAIPPGWHISNDGKPLFHAFSQPNTAQPTAESKIFDTVKISEFITHTPEIRLYYSINSDPAPGWTLNIDTMFYVFAHPIGSYMVPIYQYHEILPGNQWNLTYSLNENDPRYAGFIKDGPQFFVLPA